MAFQKRKRAGNAAWKRQQGMQREAGQPWAHCRQSLSLSFSLSPTSFSLLHPGPHSPPQPPYIWAPGGKPPFSVLRPQELLVLSPTRRQRGFKALTLGCLCAPMPGHRTRLGHGQPEALPLTDKSSAIDGSRGKPRLYFALF